MRVNGQARYAFKNKARVRIDVPLELEEDLARIHAGYTYPTYAALPGDGCWCDPEHPDSKAAVLVRYRQYQFVEAVKMDASLPEAKKGKKR